LSKIRKSPKCEKHEKGENAKNTKTQKVRKRKSEKNDQHMKLVKKGGVCHLKGEMSLYVFSEPSGGGIFAKPHGPPSFAFSA